MIIGIVGKPNVGKSAFFSSLTLAEADSQNFPFTTIDANSGMGYVKVKDPAQDFGKVSDPREGYVNGSYRFVPVKVVDVAGLVPGAHEGRGLGNKFLDDLREADVLIHVVDLSGSTNENGEPVDKNSYDTGKDIEFLEEEIDLWYYNILEKHWPNIHKKLRLQDMKLEIALSDVMSGLNVKEKEIIRALDELNLTKDNLGDNLFEFTKKIREISKPMVIAANKTDALIKDGTWETKLTNLRERYPQYKIIPVMAEYEKNLKQASKNELIDYIPGENSFTLKNEENLNENQKKGLELIEKHLQELNSTGVQDCINYAVFELLGYLPIFPGGSSKLEDDKGNTLPDCFLMPPKSTALDFAFKLHTDFGKKFIRAINVRENMPVGKNQELNFADIIEIISGK